MGENDLIQITSLIDNCAKNKYTFMETYKTVSNWIQNNKKTFIGITGLGAVVLAGFTAYYGGGYGMELSKSDEDLNKEIPSGPTIVNEKSENEYVKNSQVIVFNENDYVNKYDNNNTILDHNELFNKKIYIPDTKSSRNDINNNKILNINDEVSPINYDQFKDERNINNDNAMNPQNYVDNNTRPIVPTNMNDGKISIVYNDGTPITYDQFGNERNTDGGNFVNPSQYIQDIKLNPELTEKLYTMYTDISVDPKAYQYIKELMDKNVNLDVISGSDKYLTADECENALNILDLHNRGININNYDMISKTIKSNKFYDIDHKEIIFDQSVYDPISSKNENLNKEYIRKSNQFFEKNKIQLKKESMVDVKDIIHLIDFNKITNNHVGIIKEAVDMSVDILNSGINKNLSEIYYLFLHHGKYYAFNNHTELISLNLLDQNSKIASNVFEIDDSINFDSALIQFDNLKYLILP